MRPIGVFEFIAIRSAKIGRGEPRATIKKCVNK